MRRIAVEVHEFAYKIAKTMKKLSSSHCYFIIQQAYAGKKWGKNGELMSYEDAEEIMNRVIKECLKATIKENDK